MHNCTEVDPQTLIRTHTIEGKGSRKSVEKIAQDMRDNGFNNDFPIDVTTHNGKTYILDGHHRAAAARRTNTPVATNNVSNDQIGAHKSNHNNIQDVVDSAADTSTRPDRIHISGRRN